MKCIIRRPQATGYFFTSLLFLWSVFIIKGNKCFVLASRLLYVPTSVTCSKPVNPLRGWVWSVHVCAYTMYVCVWVMTPASVTQLPPKKWQFPLLKLEQKELWFSRTFHTPTPVDMCHTVKPICPFCVPPLPHFTLSFFLSHQLSPFSLSLNRWGCQWIST